MNTPKESASDQDLAAVVSQLPAPVQEFFANGTIEVVAKNLMQKNKLHVDQGTVMERELIMLLLGLKNAAEFTKALAQDAHLDQQTINSIVQDVNNQIFIPLRKEEEAQSKAPSPAPQVPQPTPVPTPAITIPQMPINSRPVRLGHLENKIYPHIAPLPPKATMPRPASSLEQKTLDNSHLLEDHEELHIEINQVPAKSAAVPSVQVNLPGSMPSVQIERPAAPPAPVPARPIPAFIPASFIKEYSTDPYRESVDEEGGRG